jgi:type II secretory pathway pseudopilin PulG
MTVIEWIAVIVVVGILLGLLLPAINGPSPHRGMQCATNLKNLAPTLLE